MNCPQIKSAVVIKCSAGEHAIDEPDALMHCHGRVSLSLIFSPIANHAAASLTPP
jgi:hypothetical protein